MAHGRWIAVVASLGLATRGFAVTVIVPDDNPSLTEAVAAAVSGDIIQVRPGLYGERVTVRGDQSNLTIEGLGGRPTLTPANRKDGIWVRGVEGVTANVTIRGFAFQSRKYAIRMDFCVGCVIDDVIATGCRQGIRANGAHGLTISNSTITDSGDGRGIAVLKSEAPAIGGNVVTGSRSDGIRLAATPMALVGGNSATGNRRGLSIDDAAGAVVGANETNENSAEGIRIDDSPGIGLAGHVADDNGMGIRVDDSPGLSITSSAANDNRRYGFLVDDSPPITTIADLTNAGNTATGNPDGDFLVMP